MKLYTVYYLKSSTDINYSLYVYIGWADGEDTVKAHFAEIYGMSLAMEAIVLPGVSPSSIAVKPIWSKSTANDIMAVGKDQSRYWAGSLHYGRQL